MWTSSELEAIGIYEVVIDNTNYKDKEYYINTDQSFAFGSSKVTATYGTATARALDDTTTDGVVTRGLKYTHSLICLLYTSPSPRDGLLSRMPSSA